MTEDSGRLPPMRASDADRDAVVTALGEHFQAGRITSEELDDRTGKALTARTLPELQDLTADLPSSGLPSSVPPPTLPPPTLPPPTVLPPTGLAQRTPSRQRAMRTVLAVIVVVLVLSAIHDQPRAWLAIPVIFLLVRGFSRRRGSRRP
jgi:Domain of unknown function (DUF1707)